MTARVTSVAVLCHIYTSIRRPLKVIPSLSLYTPHTPPVAFGRQRRQWRQHDPVRGLRTAQYTDL